MPSRPPITVNAVILEQRPNPYVSYTPGVVRSGYRQLSRAKPVCHQGRRARANILNELQLGRSAGSELSHSCAFRENEPPNLFSPFNRHLNKGVAAYSIEHQFNTNFSYQLPFGNGQRFGSDVSGWAKHLIGGWRWNGIFNAQSGFPFSAQTGFNNTGTGDGAVVDAVNLNPDFKGPVILGRVDHWFDPRAFAVPTAGTFGNAARSTFRGPGLFSVDTSLFKRIPIRERKTLQFRAEAFNVFNHANFAYPNGIVFQGSPANYSYSDSAGQITATATPSRQIQFALKLLF